MEDTQKAERTISINKANIYSFLMLIPIIIVFGLPYFLVWRDKFSLAQLANILENTASTNLIFGPFIFVLVMIVGIIIHELIHGITWGAFAKRGFKSIKFGIFWQMLTPYCHCKEPLKVRPYITGAIMPGIMLGFLPSIMAIINGSFLLLLFGVIFTMAAAGDFMMVAMLLKEDKDNWIEDHPSELGFYVHDAADE